MKKDQIYNLIIETTRKCNACCAHCLRGNGQGIDMNFVYVEKLLENIGSISTITFSGGEPTLNVEILKQTLDYVKEHDIYVGSIYVVTNALKYSSKLVKYMREWLEYCMQCNGYNTSQTLWERDYRFNELYICRELENYMSEFFFGLAVSIDDYHPEPNAYALKRYKNLPFYDDSKEVDWEKLRGGLLNEGRAAEYGIGERTHSKWSYDFDYDEFEGEINFDSIYLNSLGNVIPNCDFSYETQDEYFGENSIQNRSLRDIVLNSNVEKIAI